MEAERSGYQFSVVEVAGSNTRDRVRRIEPSYERFGKTISPRWIIMIVIRPALRRRLTDFAVFTVDTCNTYAIAIIVTADVVML